MQPRRKFLESSLSAMMGLSVSKYTKREHVDSFSGIKLAIATICLDGFEDKNFEPAFEIIPKTGIKNVEFNVWHPPSMSLLGIQSIRERCYQAGLTPISLQGSSFGGHATKDVAHKLWIMQQAKHLGCRRVKFTGARRGTSGGLKHIITVLRELEAAAAEMDVLICVENHANNNIENLNDYEEIFTAVNSEHVGMCLDMGHFDGAAIDNFAVIDQFHEKINHVDIKDVEKFGDYKSVPYGTGITQGEKIVAHLIEKGYHGYLVIEQAPPKTGLDLVSEMSRIRKIFEKYEH